MEENEHVSNFSAKYEKGQTEKAIEGFMELFCSKLYGIRNRKTNKFIYIGMIDNRILWCDSEKTENATLKHNEEDINSVYNIMSENNEDFNKNYFVDKIKDEDYNYESFEPIWNVNKKE